ncbi:hypothetical protein CFB82_41760 [Burkholderia sp. HI2714]|uniref:hypothetical protein n=1 Tax=Burkholderia sp. HI2714 TaxID=2015359 RepID=UPI000B7A8A9F|nr:hypothetical protein [Burkholderia sp. HI2714]OXJ20854.1 hypothetical protein CFB82_41760 [Burkholderia sp. HI2714]
MEILKSESNVKKKAQPQYSAEMRARAVRMVLDHQREYESEWAAINIGFVDVAVESGAWFTAGLHEAGRGEVAMVDNRRSLFSEGRG